MDDSGDELERCTATAGITCVTAVTSVPSLQQAEVVWAAAEHKLRGEA